MRTLIVLIMLAFSATALAGQYNCKADPDIKCLLDGTRVNYAVCKFSAGGTYSTMELAIMQGGSVDWAEESKCLNQAKEEMRPVYERAVKTASKGRVAALKDYYAYWLASMDNMLPNPGERKLAFERRLQERGDEISQMANRIKLGE